MDKLVFAHHVPIKQLGKGSYGTVFLARTKRRAKEMEEEEEEEAKKRGGTSKQEPPSTQAHVMETDGTHEDDHGALLTDGASGLALSIAGDSENGSNSEPKERHSGGGASTAGSPTRQVSAGLNPEMKEEYSSDIFTSSSQRHNRRHKRYNSDRTPPSATGGGQIEFKVTGPLIASLPPAPNEPDEVAIKVMSCYNDHADPQRVQRLWREIAILHAAQDLPQVVTLFGIEEAAQQATLGNSELVDPPRDLYVRMPVLPFTLWDLTKNPRRFNDEQHFVPVIGQLLLGVSQLHEDLGVVHRDLSSNNVLVGRELDTYISDFGFARVAENTMSRGRVTLVVAFLNPLV